MYRMGRFSAGCFLCGLILASYTWNMVLCLPNTKWSFLNNQQILQEHVPMRHVASTKDAGSHPASPQPHTATWSKLIKDYMAKHEVLTSDHINHGKKVQIQDLASNVDNVNKHHSTGASNTVPHVNEIPHQSKKHLEPSRVKSPDTLLGKPEANGQINPSGAPEHVVNTLKSGVGVKSTNVVSVQDISTKPGSPMLIELLNKVVVTPSAKGTHSKTTDPLHTDAGTVSPKDTGLRIANVLPHIAVMMSETVTGGGVNSVSKSVVEPVVAKVQAQSPAQTVITPTAKDVIDPVHMSNALEPVSLSPINELVFVELSTAPTATNKASEMPANRSSIMPKSNFDISQQLESKLFSYPILGEVISPQVVRESLVHESMAFKRTPKQVTSGRPLHVNTQPGTHGHMASGGPASPQLPNAFNTQPRNHGSIPSSGPASPQNSNAFNSHAPQQTTSVVGPMEQFAIISQHVPQQQIRNNAAANNNPPIQQGQQQQNQQVFQPPANIQNQQFRRFGKGQRQKLQPTQHQQHRQQHQLRLQTLAKQQQRQVQNQQTPQQHNQLAQQINQQILKRPQQQINNQHTQHNQQPFAQQNPQQIPHKQQQIQQPTQHHQQQVRQAQPHQAQHQQPQPQQMQQQPQHIQHRQQQIRQPTQHHQQQVRQAQTQHQQPLPQQIQQQPQHIQHQQQQQVWQQKPQQIPQQALQPQQQVLQQQIPQQAIQQQQIPQQAIQQQQIPQQAIQQQQIPQQTLHNEQQTNQNQHQLQQTLPQDPQQQQATLNENPRKRARIQIHSQIKNKRIGRAMEKSMRNFQRQFAQFPSRFEAPQQPRQHNFQPPQRNLAHLVPVMLSSTPNFREFVQPPVKAQRITAKSTVQKHGNSAHQQETQAFGLIPLAKDIPISSSSWTSQPFSGYGFFNSPSVQSGAPVNRQPSSIAQQVPVESVQHAQAASPQLVQAGSPQLVQAGSPQQTNNPLLLPVESSLLRPMHVSGQSAPPLAHQVISVSIPPVTPGAVNTNDLAALRQLVASSIAHQTPAEAHTGRISASVSTGSGMLQPVRINSGNLWPVSASEHPLSEITPNGALQTMYDRGPNVNRNFAQHQQPVSTDPFARLAERVPHPSMSFNSPISHRTQTSRSSNALVKDAPAKIENTWNSKSTTSHSSSTLTSIANNQVPSSEPSIQGNGHVVVNNVQPTVGRTAPLEPATSVNGPNAPHSNVVVMGIGNSLPPHGPNNNGLGEQQSMNPSRPFHGQSGPHSNGVGQTQTNSVVGQQQTTEHTGPFIGQNVLQINVDLHQQTIDRTDPLHGQNVLQINRDRHQQTMKPPAPFQGQNILQINGVNQPISPKRTGSFNGQHSPQHHGVGQPQTMGHSSPFQGQNGVQNNGVSPPQTVQPSGPFIGQNDPHINTFEHTASQGNSISVNGQTDPASNTFSPQPPTGPAHSTSVLNTYPTAPQTQTPSSRHDTTLSGNAAPGQLAAEPHGPVTNGVVHRQSDATFSTLSINRMTTTQPRLTPTMASSVTGSGPNTVPMGQAGGINSNGQNQLEAQGVHGQMQFNGHAQVPSPQQMANMQASANTNQQSSSGVNTQAQNNQHHLDQLNQRVHVADVNGHPLRTTQMVNTQPSANLHPQSPGVITTQIQGNHHPMNSQSHFNQQKQFAANGHSTTGVNTHINQHSVNSQVRPQTQFSNANGQIVSSSQMRNTQSNVNPVMTQQGAQVVWNSHGQPQPQAHGVNANTRQLQPNPWNNQQTANNQIQLDQQTRTVNGHTNVASSQTHTVNGHTNVASSPSQAQVRQQMLPANSHRSIVVQIHPFGSVNQGQFTQQRQSGITHDNLNGGTQTGIGAGNPLNHQTQTVQHRQSNGGGANQFAAGGIGPGQFNQQMQSVNRQGGVAAAVSMSQVQFPQQPVNIWGSVGPHGTRSTSQGGFLLPIQIVNPQSQFRNVNGQLTLTNQATAPNTQTAAQQARAKLRAKIRTMLTAGLDPEEILEFYRVELGQ